MKRNVMLLIAGLLAIGLIAAGCGDDDEDGGDGGDALTKEEFVAQGNAICEEGSAELDAAGNEVFQGGEPTPEELDAFVNDTFVPNIQGQIDEIRDLTPPEGDEDTVTGFLDDAETALGEIEADPESAFGGGGGDNPFAQVNEQLSAYGLSACSEG